jgi:ABC-type molybdate transport system substrate-binding protein
MFPEQGHPPIIYPVAMVNELVYAREFIAFSKLEIIFLLISI